MAKNNPQVVIIDDSPTSNSLYQRSCEGLSVDLISFVSPNESLEFLRTNKADLVLMDILIREKDGLTVLKELRGIEGHAETAVVIVTSKNYAQDRNIAKQLGVLDYLVKPLRSQEIREIIRQYTDAQTSSE